MLLRTALALLLLTGAASLAGCGKDAAAPAQQLQHTWTWTGSSGGFTGGTETPTSTGQQRKIEFDAHGNFRAYTNGQLVHTDTYQLQTGTSIRSSQPTTLIVYGKGGIQSFDISGRSLTLSAEVYDGYQSSYER